MWNMQTIFPIFSRATKIAPTNFVTMRTMEGMLFLVLLKDGNMNRIHFFLNYVQAAEFCQPPSMPWVLM